MKTVFWLKFTKPEIEHLNSLIKKNEEEGSYVPPKMSYWNRSARIRKKLSDISKTCYMFQMPAKKHLQGENYVTKERHDLVVKMADDLLLALKEQKRLYFELYDKEKQCMYCEKTIKLSEGIFICKECSE